VKRRRPFIALFVLLALVVAAITATAISAKPAKRNANSIEVLSL
jgi:hypothetical protein